MHTALVSRLMKDRSAWEMTHAATVPAVHVHADAGSPGVVRGAALVGA
jgi:hypothetical protein